MQSLKCQWESKYNTIFSKIKNPKIPSYSVFRTCSSFFSFWHCSCMHVLGAPSCFSLSFSCWAMYLFGAMIRRHSTNPGRTFLRPTLPTRCKKLCCHGFLRNAINGNKLKLSRRAREWGECRCCKRPSQRVHLQCWDKVGKLSSKKKAATSSGWDNKLFIHWQCKLQHCTIKI